MKSKPQASKLPPMSRPTMIFSLALFGVMAVILLLFLLWNPLALPYLPGATTQDKAVAHGPVESESTVYQCPMHPEVIEAEPGACPICGMDLVPRDAVGVMPGKQEDESGEEQGTVVIDPVQIQNMGVVSVPATLGEMARTVRTVGILDFNADQISWVNTKFSFLNGLSAVGLAFLTGPLQSLLFVPRYTEVGATPAGTGATPEGT